MFREGSKYIDRRLVYVKGHGGLFQGGPTFMKTENNSNCPRNWFSRWCNIPGC